MTIFDLLFILLFLAAIVALVRSLWALLRGQPAVARGRFRRLALGAAGYFAVLILVSLFTPRRYLALRENHCSDDWCIAVTAAVRIAPVDSTRWRITLRLSSRMGAGSQRELGVVAYLVDDQGRRFNAMAQPDALPFDTQLGPMQQVATTRTFVVPTDATGLGLITDREGWPPNPRCCIIGDEGSLLHKRTVVRLE